MSISVIISNLNGLKYLPRLLESLRSQRNVNLQIIVVDRFSQDGSLEYLAKQSDVTIINEPPQTGLVSGYAAGVPFAKYELLFFCNEDMWFDPDCLHLLEKQIDLNANIIAADPWQWTYDGETLIHAGTGFQAVIWNPLSPYPFRRLLFTVPVISGSRIPFPCAGAFLIHRKAYEAVGGWDRSFFLDNEDIDLFIRVWQRGWHCVSVPESKVYHAVGASNTQQIVTINTPVKIKRFLSCQSSISVIGWKYFTSVATIYPFLFPFLTILKDALRLRPRQTWLAVQALRETIRRFQEAFRYRSKFRALNRTRPGQRFFTAPEFNPVLHT